jgi:hypothetical protein
MRYVFKKPVGVAIVALSSVMLAACASNSAAPDSGQRLVARGDAISQRGDDWKKGQENRRDGQKLVQRSADETADGEKKLERARDAIAKAEIKIQTAAANRQRGEQMISDGVAKMERAETAYSDIRSGPSAIEPN